MSGAIINFANRAVLSTHKLNKYQYTKYLVKYASTQAETKVLECLNNRSLLRVTGEETSNFLQGLITNDMKHLENGSANIYSLFLNNKGRVMYDTIIYKSQEKDMYFIECDSQVTEALQKHLKLYRVRRKIDIEPLEGKMKIWSVFNANYSSTDMDSKTEKQKFEGLIFPCGTLNNKASKFIDNIMIYEDPRLSSLGYRILSESNVNKDEIIKHLDSDVSDPASAQSYRSFRYKIGIGEGIEDLPPGKSFPLEINCDYLHGVSFHKGCYIGQELTARTYHTGVVRKRLMPLMFEREPDKSITYDEKIVDESGKVVGKFRGVERKYGLALMRIAEALKAESLSILGINVKVTKPTWWPHETQKERLSLMQETASTSDEIATTTQQNVLSNPTIQRVEESEKMFVCSICLLREHIDYKGSKPPFARQMKFLEEGYIMKDPFSAPNKGEVLLLGADCSICKKAVCLGCSIFYGKRFCQKCASDNISHFPAQIQSKVRNLIKDTHS